MKIKTITCHDVYNLGASLQAYALMEYLTQLGHEVEIIDYKPEYLSRHYKLSLIANPKYEKNIILKSVYLLLKLPRRLVEKYGKRKREFDKFKREYLKLTARRYASNQELKRDLPEADLYIAGSDQIWNTLFQNGKDPAFYLEFVPQDKGKISYAASFATANIAQEYSEKIRGWLTRLDCISVRELSGIKILQDLGIDWGKVVLDPVFLLSRREWEVLLKPSERKREKYLLVYDFDNSEYIEKLAKRLSKKNQWKIYSIQKSKYADRVFWKSGPLEFLELIDNAEFIISNSFHATAFSLIFNKQFVVVNRKEGINTRMKDLLSIVNLENRMLYEGKEEIFLIDYKEVNILLKNKIDESRKYLDSVIEMVEKNGEKKYTFCD